MGDANRSETEWRRRLQNETARDLNVPRFRVEGQHRLDAGTDYRGVWTDGAGVDRFCGTAEDHWHETEAGARQCIMRRW